MKVYLSIDRIGLSQKPQGYQLVEAKKRASANWLEMELKEAADRIGNGGYAAVPGYMVGGLKAENCRAMQIFMLDFDAGIRFVDIKRRCEKTGIPISFAYHTYSSSEKKERFRVAFVHECLINDIFIIKVVLQMLYSIFQECDRSCSNPDRMFLGGKELIYLNETAHFALMQIHIPFLRSLDGNKNFSRNVESFCRKNKIAVYNGRPAMGDASCLSGFEENDGKKDSVIIHSIKESAFPSFCILENKVTHQSIRRRQEKRKLEIEEESGCHLLDDFLIGIEVDHDQKFAILGNLMQINGGIKKFFEVMETFYDSDSIEKWKKDVHYMKGYSPKRCSGSFCPYYETCEHMGNIVDTIAMGRKVKREEETYFTLEEVTKCLEESLNKAYHSSGDGIHLIKAQTGVGKTTAYINLIKKDVNGKFIIAVPTNMLKKEIYTRLLQAGILPHEIFMTISIKGNPLIPEDIQKAVSEAHDRGEHDLPREIVRNYYHEIQNDAARKCIAEECRRYLSGVDAISGERIIVTTHAYLMNMTESMLQRYTVIVDEDILQLYLLKQTAKVSVNCLQVLAERNLMPYSEIAGQMLRAGEEEYHRILGGGRAVPLMVEEIEKLECRDGSNINDMAYAGSFVKRKNEQTGKQEVMYFFQRQFPKAKYIILSATLNEKVYRRYFGGKINVLSYPYRKTRYRGRLIQYTYHSLGRKDLKGKPQVFSFAKKIAGNEDVEIVTFLNAISLNELGENNISRIHFGNSTGLNLLEGKDLVIIGTPYSIQEAYKLVACYLGADVNQKIDRQPKIRRVTYNHCSFIITTYNEPLLREIQLYSIESELEQCIGRTRILRHDCSVYVFSCFPCEQADIHIKNYLIHTKMDEQEEC